MPDPNLTEALALQNPRAYAARFKRLTPGERTDFVRALSPSAYFHHARALGESPEVQVLVSLDRAGGLHWCEVVFGGLRVKRDQQGWADAKATLAQVLGGLPTEVLVVGHVMVPSDPRAAEAFFSTGLPALGWKVTEVHFSESDRSDGGRIRFAFADAVVTFVGTTGRGELRAHAAVEPGQVAAREPGWSALARQLGLRWQRS